jgi:hypothetical protein
MHSHWPVPHKRLDTWRAMEHLHATGKARAIGVSNYMVRHLEELRTHAKVMPHVNQARVLSSAILLLFVPFGVQCAPSLAMLTFADRLHGGAALVRSASRRLRRSRCR